MVAGARNPVPAQPAAAPRFGLLASIPPTGDIPRWESGIKYSPEGCNEGTTYGDVCDSPENIPSTIPDVVEWDPYVVSASETCSTFSGAVDEESLARVLRLLNADTERQLGAEFWDGTQSQATTGSPNTWLADLNDPNFVDLTGASAAGYVEALSCLEQYLADNNAGQQGVIHATAQVVTSWESFRFLRREGNRILTFKDTVVIPSPGYSGNGPTYSDGIWAFATDMPRIFLGDIQTFPLMQSVDRQQNSIEVLAQRFALVEWQRCRHAGIQLDVDPCGAAS